MPPMPASNGKAKRRRSRSSPRSISRRASSPTTKKKNVISPLFTQWRRSSETPASATSIDSFVLQSESYDDASTFTHASAATAAASKTAAPPVSVRKNSRSGVSRLRAHAVRPENVGPSFDSLLPSRGTLNSPAMQSRANRREAAGSGAPDVERALVTSSTDHCGVAREPLALIAGESQRLLVWPGHQVSADERGPVRVAARGEHLLHCIAERKHHHAPVVEGVVERQDRRLLPSVSRLRGGKAGRDLVRELAFLPEPPRLIDVLLELGGDVAEAGGRSEGDPVCPLEIGEGRHRLLADDGPVAAPVLVLRDHELRGELFHVAQTDLRPRLLGALGNCLRETVHVAGSAVVDDCHSRFHLSPRLSEVRSLRTRQVVLTARGARSAQPEADTRMTPALPGPTRPQRRRPRTRSPGMRGALPWGWWPFAPPRRAEGRASWFRNQSRTRRWGATVAAAGRAALVRCTSSKSAHEPCRLRARSRRKSPRGSRPRDRPGLRSACRRGAAAGGGGRR